MRKLYTSACAVGLVGLIGLGCTGQVQAGTIVAGSSIDAYTTLAQASAYDAVGMFSWDGGYASGTYIGNGWVLTAAHVADSSDSLTFTVGGIEYSSEQIVINENWTGDVSRGGDMALVKLTADVTDIDAAQLYDFSLFADAEEDTDTSTDTVLGGMPGINLSGQGFGRFGGRGGFGFQGRMGHHGRGWGHADMGPFPDDEESLESLLGQVVTMVGYGMTGDGETGAVEDGGTKIAGQNTIDWTGRMLWGYDESLLFIDFDDPDADDDFRWRFDRNGSDAVDLEYLIAGGDSGGGVFIEGEDGESYLLAVNSFLLAFDGDIDADYGDLGAFTSVTGYLDWIYEVTGLNDIDSSTEDVIETVVAVIPEPTTLLLGLTQGIALMMLRRRDA